MSARTRLTSVVSTGLAAALTLTACMGTADTSVGGESTVTPDVTAPTVDTATPTTAAAQVPTSIDPSTIEAPPLSDVWRPVNEPGVGGRVTDLLVVGDRIFAAGDMLGVSYTDNDGASWETTTGFASWEVATLTPHPDDDQTIWAGTMSGPHVSQDGGSTWSLRREGMGPISDTNFTAAIEVVLFDPTDATRLVAFGGSQREWGGVVVNPSYGIVWESLDGGETWAELAVIATAANLSAATYISDTEIVVSSLGGGIYRSDDSGVSWTSSDDGLAHGMVSDLVAHPADESKMWAALRATEEFGGGIYASSDRGLTWAWTDQTIFGEGGPLRGSAEFVDIAMGQQEPYPIFASNGGDDDQAIYRSVDEGRSWERLLNKSGRVPTAYASGPSAEAFAVDPNDADRVLVGQSEYILLSNNQGGDWADITSFSLDGRTFRGTGFSGLVATDIAVRPNDTDQMLLTGFDGANLLASEDGGVNWRRPLVDWDPWGGASDVLISGLRDQRIHVVLGQASTFNGLARSDDFGETWRFIEGEESGLPARDAAVSPGKILADPENSQRYWLTLGNDIYVSTDVGSSWRPLGNIPSVHQLELIAVGANTLYAGGDDGLFRSTDGGTTFSLVEGSPPAVVGVYPIGGTSPDIYVLSADSQDGGVWIWDNQLTWTLQRADPAVSDLLIDPVDRSRMILATDDDPFHDISAASGIWISTDDGRTWANRSEGLPMLRIDTLALIDDAERRVVAGTTGRGFFEASFAALVQPDQTGPTADDSTTTTADPTTTEQQQDS